MENKKSIFYEKPLHHFMFVKTLVNFTAKIFRKGLYFIAKITLFMVIQIFYGFIIHIICQVAYFVTTNSIETLTLLMLSFVDTYKCYRKTIENPGEL